MRLVARRDDFDGEIGGGALLLAHAITVFVEPCHYIRFTVFARPQADGVGRVEGFSQFVFGEPEIENLEQPLG